MHSLLLDDQLCFAVYAASRAMISVYRPVLDELGLTYPQYLTMLVLWAEGSASVSHLGDRLMLDSGTLTPLLKRLERLGLVERKRSAADERVVDITLTAAGKKLRSRAHRMPEAMAAKLRGVRGDGAALREQLRLLTTILTAVPTEDRKEETP